MGSKHSKWGILSVTSLGALLSALNFSTLIIALPDLIKGLHASLLQAMWIMLSYMVAQTVMVLMAGSLADLFGRKRLYILGMVLFTLVSLGSGFVINPSWLIFARVLQGIGGAMVMANSTAIVADAFPQEELGKALGINIMVVAVGQILGPVLGGWLTTAYGWEWTFWFNVPFGIVAVLWALWIMGFSPEEEAKETIHLDINGIITYIVSITGLLLVLTWGPLQGWTETIVIVSGILFIIAFPIFLYIENRHVKPLVHLPLFKNPIFTLGAVTATLNSVSRMGIMFMLIFYFQGVMSFDALKAGILTTPLAIGMLLVAPFAGWLGDKIGVTAPATAGLFVTMIGSLGLALDTNIGTPYWRLALWMLITSIGAGLFNSPNSSSMMNIAGSKYRGEASGIRSLVTNVGMMLSIAFTMPVVMHSIPKAAMLAIFSGTEVGLKGGASALHGFITGLHQIFWIMSILMLAATFLSLLRANKGNKSNKVLEVELNNLTEETV